MPTTPRPGHSTLALKVDSIETMMKVKARMEAADGIQVLGPTNHTIFQSIYFRGPSGHRLSWL